jgi:hypothetical protein
MAFSAFFCRLMGYHRTSAVYAQRRRTQFPLRASRKKLRSAMPWFHRTQEIRDAVTTAAESSPDERGCTLQCGNVAVDEIAAPDPLQGVSKAAHSRRLSRSIARERREEPEIISACG